MDWVLCDGLQFSSFPVFAGHELLMRRGARARTSFFSSAIRGLAGAMDGDSVRNEGLKECEARPQVSGRSLLPRVQLRQIPAGVAAQCPVVPVLRALSLAPSQPRHLWAPHHPMRAVLFLCYVPPTLFFRGCRTQPEVATVATAATANALRPLQRRSLHGPRGPLAGGRGRSPRPLGNAGRDQYDQAHSGQWAVGSVKTEISMTA